MIRGIAVLARHPIRYGGDGRCAESAAAREGVARDLVHGIPGLAAPGEEQMAAFDGLAELRKCESSLASSGLGA